MSETAAKSDPAFCFGHLSIIPKFVSKFASYHKTKSLCSHLGGIMSLNYIQETQFVIGSSDCQTVSWYDSTFWIPIIQGGPVANKEGHFHWIDDRLGLNGSVVQLTNWLPGQPNGELSQQCVEAETTSEQNLWNDEYCHVKRCSICTMPLVQTYRLRGLTMYDQEYTLSLNIQENKSRILFEGKKSTIIWFPFDGTLEVRQHFNGDLAIEKFQGPFGHLKSEEHGKTRGKLVFTNVSTTLE